ncbi:MAG TPA: trypsin-like peptidase domain-containing protein [Pirellulales bacterium]
MRDRTARQGWRFPLAIVGALGLLAAVAAEPGASAAEPRRTAIVEAVEQARSAIVNIHGEKTVDAADAASGEGKRRVNGMGTGVIIDQRGYIVTNHHVVDGVRKIMVTTAEGENYVARLVSHDPKTDLAIIKIDADRDFQIIHIGTSADLMPGETVIAVGNAFGYEHTVTRGIVSALHRTVQVSDAQNYEDLIQTDASINPGNSGGPLLNIEGDMIGVNVAVRAGAQGIGFAIPADKVLAVATELISSRRLEGTWLGVVGREAARHAGLAVSDVDSDSPAADGGLRAGDTITSIDRLSVERPLDLERALLGHHAGETVDVAVERDRQPLHLKLTLGKLPTSELAEADSVWNLLGLRLESIPARQFQQYRSRYRGGLSVSEVRPDSPAARQGIRRGDILVGMHVWETISIENVAYILGRPDFAQLGPLKFYILRGNETLFGHLTVSQRNQQR